MSPMTMSTHFNAPSHLSLSHSPCVVLPLLNKSSTFVSSAQNLIESILPSPRLSGLLVISDSETETRNLQGKSKSSLILNPALRVYVSPLLHFFRRSHLMIQFLGFPDPLILILMEGGSLLFCCGDWIRICPRIVSLFIFPSEKNCQFEAILIFSHFLMVWPDLSECIYLLLWLEDWSFPF